MYEYFRETGLGWKKVKQSKNNASFCSVSGGYKPPLIAITNYELSITNYFDILLLINHLITELSKLLLAYEMSKI
jgi:hypothetical protein